MLKQLVLWSVLLSALHGVTACGSATSEPSGAKTECLDSTYETIQAAIFEARGCTQLACHGESMAGELGLRAGASHEALVHRSSSIDPALKRVSPGDQDRSLLYLKLEAGVDGSDLGTLGQAMPVGADPITPQELEAVRLWIRGGARADGVVEGTMERLACDGSFDEQPNKITPLPPPAPDEGIQFYAGGWALSAESEDEVCFVTYYDFSELVPDEARLPCGDFEPGRECFAFRRSELAQDGQSHHSITTVYTPESDPNGGSWIKWECLGGENAGAPCDPTDTDPCGERAACATPPQSGLACVDYFFAPADFNFGSDGFTGASATRDRLLAAQESVFVEDNPKGVYSILPVSGFVAWNSHAFNLTRQDTTIEQWINLTYAKGEQRQWRREQIFASENVLNMGVIPAFEKREVCMTFTLPQYTRLMTLTSHFHQRGELFRMWLPPNDVCLSTSGCEVPTREADYENRLYDDPHEERYDQPLPLDGADKRERTIKACAIWDNGADDPMEVKRHSTRPDSPSCLTQFANCGCIESDRVCLAGDRQGARCDGTDDACGAGGLCDACPLLGGVTTDDEMFLPLGSYYVTRSD